VDGCLKQVEASTCMRVASDRSRCFHAHFEGVSPCSSCSVNGMIDECKLYSVDADSMDSEEKFGTVVTPLAHKYGGLVSHLPWTRIHWVRESTVDTAVSAEALSLMCQLPRQVACALGTFGRTVLVTLLGRYSFYNPNFDLRIKMLSRAQLWPVEHWNAQITTSVFQLQTHAPLLSQTVPCFVWAWASIFDQLHSDSSFPCPQEFLACNSAFSREFGWTFVMLREIVRSPSVLCHVDDLFTVMHFMLRRQVHLSVMDPEWFVPIEILVPRVRVLLPNGGFRCAALTLRIIRSPARIPTVGSCSLLPL
jgi:hypothetical protein